MACTLAWIKTTPSVRIPKNSQECPSMTSNLRHILGKEMFQKSQILIPPVKAFPGPTTKRGVMTFLRSSCPMMHHLQRCPHLPPLEWNMSGQKWASAHCARSQSTGAVMVTLGETCQCFTPHLFTGSVQHKDPGLTVISCSKLWLISPSGRAHIERDRERVGMAGGG